MKILKTCFLTGAMALSASAALASDLPLRNQAPLAPLVSQFTWTGFYVGAHAGYGWTIDDPVGIHTADGVFRGNIGNLTPSAFAGGLQAGYNLQSGNIVYGLEADVSFTSRSGNVAGVLPVALASTAREKTNVFGSFRGRLGYAFDRTLVYVTGGVGLTNVKYSLTTRAGAGFGSNDSTKVGFVAGAGLQYAFTNNWIGRVEGLYYGVRGYTLRNSVGPVDFTKPSPSHALARIGLDYKF